MNCMIGMEPHNNPARFIISVTESRFRSRAWLTLRGLKEQLFA